MVHSRTGSVCPSCDGRSMDGRGFGVEEESSLARYGYATLLLGS